MSIKQFGKLSSLKDEEIASLVASLAMFDGNRALAAQAFEARHGKEISTDLIKQVEREYADKIKEHQKQLQTEGRARPLFTPLGRMLVIDDLFSQISAYRVAAKQLKKASSDMKGEAIELERKLTLAYLKQNIDSAMALVELVKVANALDAKTREQSGSSDGYGLHSVKTGIANSDWDVFRKKENA